MNARPNSPTFHVVRNHHEHESIWPDYRREALPAGWGFTGFSGTRAACLQNIAERPALMTANALSPAPEPPVFPPVARPAGRATAVPFPRPAAPWRLFVFPHAGSGASYYHFLARALKDDRPELHVLQYPGREMRVKEPPLTSMPAMTRALESELQPLLTEKPFAFFGHSMGALAAFELTRSLQAAGSPLPRHLFLSGRQAPQIPGPVLNVESLDDAAFLDAIGRRYNALPAELMANREILDIVLPSLRADFTLMEQYACRDAPPLDVPFTLLNGIEDPWIEAASLGAWQVHSRHPVRQRMFAGGHFYLPAAAAELRAVVLDTLAM